MTVSVYRNLRHGKKARPLYSIVSNGRVVDRRHRVLLTGVKFVVRPAGREAVLKTGRKNVHAFARGVLVGPEGAFGIDHDGKDLPVRVTYNPKRSANFETDNGTPVVAARGVLLNEHGISACYLE